MEDPITRAEYEEYQKRMEQEDHRQNRRIEQLEENTKQINALTVSIEKGKYVVTTLDDVLVMLIERTNKSNESKHQ